MLERILLFSLFSMIFTFSACSRRTENQEIFQRFSSCPNRPNCVSSISSKSQRFIEPINYTGVVNPIAKLSVIMKKMPRVRSITEEEMYLHFEVRSILFRFVDDVEFYYDEKAGLIQMKSAARAGYFDFGVNRNRLEKVREKFN